jgi:hypothetical protein
LVDKSLQDKCVSAEVTLMIRNIEDLQEIWSKLDMCYERLIEFITEALLTIVSFRRYKAFDNTAIREFCSLLRATVIGVVFISLFKMLVNKQSLVIIVGRMPATDWK